MALNDIILWHVLVGIQICFTTYKFIKKMHSSARGPPPEGAVGRQVQSAPECSILTTAHSE